MRIFVMERNAHMIFFQNAQRSKSNLLCWSRNDSFKKNLCCHGCFFAQVSIVPISVINLPNMLCPRSEWLIIMFSGFYLDIEELAVPAKCLSTIILGLYL